MALLTCLYKRYIAMAKDKKLRYIILRTRCLLTLFDCDACPRFVACQRCLSTDKKSRKWSPLNIYHFLEALSFTKQKT